MQAQLNPSRHLGPGEITLDSREICNSQEKKREVVRWKFSHVPSTKSINLAASMPLLFLLPSIEEEVLPHKYEKPSPGLVL